MSAPKHAFIYDEAREHQAAKFVGRKPQHRRESPDERWQRLCSQVIRAPRSLDYSRGPA